MDDAEGDEEREVVNKACPMLPEKPEKLYGIALTPKEDERAHGEGATRASLYSQAKKKLKLKTAASDDDKARLSKRQAKGHHKTHGNVQTTTRTRH